MNDVHGILCKNEEYTMTTQLQVRNSNKNTTLTIFNSDLMVYYRNNGTPPTYTVGGQEHTPVVGFIKGSHQKDHSTAVKWSGGEANSANVTVPNYFDNAYLIPNTYDDRMGNKVFKILLISEHMSFIVDFYATNFIEMLGYGLTVDGNGKFNKPILYVTGGMWVPHDYPNLVGSKDESSKKVTKKGLEIGQLYSDKREGVFHLYLGMENGAYKFATSYVTGNSYGASMQYSLMESVTSMSNDITGEVLPISSYGHWGSTFKGVDYNINVHTNSGRHYASIAVSLPYSGYSRLRDVARTFTIPTLYKCKCEPLSQDVLNDIEAMFTKEITIEIDGGVVTIKESL